MYSHYVLALKSFVYEEGLYPESLCDSWKRKGCRIYYDECQVCFTMVHERTQKQLKWLLFQEMKNTTRRETSQVWLQPIGSNSLSMSRWESNVSDKKWQQSKNVSFGVCISVYVYIYRHLPNPWELSLGAKEKWGNVLAVPMDKTGKAKPKPKRWLARYTQNQRKSSYVSTQRKIFFIEWETNIFEIYSWLLSSCLDGKGQLCGRCLIQLMCPQMTALYGQS